MQAAIELFSHIPVQKALEIACGHSPHLEHILRLGYEYHGLDLSTSMLDYAEAKAAALGFSAKLFQADLADFTLPEPVDFAYIMLGSLYVQTTEQLLSHFASVERALKPGGLYFLDWCIDFSPLTNTRDAWSCRRNGVEVKVRYTTNSSPARQHYEESLYGRTRWQHRLHLSHPTSGGHLSQEFMLRQPISTDLNLWAGGTTGTSVHP